MSRRKSQTQILQLPERYRSRGGSRRPVLVVVQGDELGRRYPLPDGRLILGRDPDGVDLAIPDPSVSARHAMLHVDAERERFGIVDLGSRNGTYLNGAPLSNGSLREGDKVFVGTTVLKFTFHDSIEEHFHGELDRLMHLDSLTGLYVRRWFDQEYPKAFARALAREQPISLAMMDLDGLKQINDEHGHQLGSHCIAEAGRIIKACLPDGAAGARFGGDEFVVWFADCGLEAAVQVAETIRVRIESFEFRLESVVVAPTISIGLAALAADARQPDELMREADAALYRAKQAGRNAVSR